MNYPKNRNSKSRRKNYAGEQIGYIDVLKYIERIENEKEIREYECYCNACRTNTIMSHNALMVAKSHMVAEGKMPSCGCMKSIGIKNWNGKNRKDLTGMTFGYLYVIGPAEIIYVGTKSKHRQTWKCQCVCGSIIYVTTGDLTSGNTKSCGCILSRGEAIVAEILTKNHIKYRKEYSYHDLLTSNGFPCRFDFAIQDKKKNIVCLVEYQGIQHYKDLGWFGRLEREETDQKKKDYCKANQIKLFEIPYNSNIENEVNKIIRYVHDNTVPSMQETA